MTSGGSRVPEPGELRPEGGCPGRNRVDRRVADPGIDEVPASSFTPKSATFWQPGDAGGRVPGTALCVTLRGDRSPGSACPPPGVGFPPLLVDAQASDVHVGSACPGPRQLWPASVRSAGGEEERPRPRRRCPRIVSASLIRQFGDPAVDHSSSARCTGSPQHVRLVRPRRQADPSTYRSRPRSLVAVTVSRADRASGELDMASSRWRSRARRAHHSSHDVRGEVRPLCPRRHPGAAARLAPDLP